MHATGRPILVGTLTRRGIGAARGPAASRRRVRCDVLNARNDEAEARIVAPRRRARRGDHLHEHGRPRHRHPPRRRHGRRARERVGGARRPLRHRHQPSREPPHRFAAARPRRPAGRSRRVAVLHQPRRRPAGALRHPAPARRPLRRRRRAASRSTTRSCCAKSPGRSGSSKGRTSRSAGRWRATRQVLEDQRRRDRWTGGTALLDGREAPDVWQRSPNGARPLVAAPDDEPSARPSGW